MKNWWIFVIFFVVVDVLFSLFFFKQNKIKLVLNFPSSLNCRHEKCQIVNIHTLSCTLVNTHNICEWTHVFTFRYTCKHTYVNTCTHIHTNPYTYTYHLYMQVCTSTIILYTCKHAHANISYFFFFFCPCFSISCFFAISTSWKHHGIPPKHHGIWMNAVIQSESKYFGIFCQNVYKTRE